MLKKLLIIALVITLGMPKVKAEENKYRITYEYETRLTSFYPRGNVVSTTTGSGLDVRDFEVNEYGWYTYDGKLVIATATDYLLNYGWKLNEGVRLYTYYDVLILNIDGTDYEAIVLDSCGICMTTGRIDLFVTDRNAVIDTFIIVKEVINEEMV